MSPRPTPHRAQTESPVYPLAGARPPFLEGDPRRNRAFRTAVRITELLEAGLILWEDFAEAPSMPILETAARSANSLANQLRTMGAPRYYVVRALGLRERIAEAFTHEDWQGAHRSANEIAALLADGYAITPGGIR